MPSLLQITGHGLVLWRLGRAPDQQVICRVSDFCGDLVLGIHSDSAGDSPVGEVHEDIVSLVKRADAVRETLRSAGWQDVEPEPTA